MRPLVVGIALLVAGCSASRGHSPTAQPSARQNTPTTTQTTAPPERPVPAEKNPPGDIPDNLAFVRYSNGAGHYSFTHPEGWAETTHGSSVLFTDKLNGVQVALGGDATPPTVARARQQDVPRLRGSQPAFELRDVVAVTLPSGTGVRITYRRNSKPDAVTGRQYRDEVERYEIVRGGHEVVMELYGPVGADNVDAYRTMSQSLRFR